MRTNKYGAKRSFGYDSNAERDYADVLEMKKRGGLIKDFIHHPPAVKWGNAPHGTSWKIDFLVTLNDDAEIYVEYKGFPTDYYKIKYKWFKSDNVAPIIVMGGNKTKGFAEIERFDADGIEF
jgi:hypothetical protein